jgi:Mg/Co/Ni transporter MgtE
MPPGAARKLRSLLGFNPTSAGGLMGLDHLALPGDITVAEALDAVSLATDHEPLALTTVYVVDEAGRLAGSIGLVALIQADPATALASVAEQEPVRVGADTDLQDVAVLMTDYNLLSLPVVDDDDQLLGVITVDDALEATVPDPWRRRGDSPP